MCPALNGFKVEADRDHPADSLGDMTDTPVITCLSRDLCEGFVLMTPTSAKPAESINKGLLKYNVTVTVPSVGVCTYTKRREFIHPCVRMGAAARHACI